MHAALVRASVRNLLTQLTIVSGFYGTMQTDELAGVSATLGLTTKKPGSSTIDLMLETMGLKLLQRIGSIVPAALRPVRLHHRFRSRDRDPADHRAEPPRRSGGQAADRRPES